MNADGKPARPGTEPKVIVELLKKQLTHPVLWETSMKEIIKENITEFYEVGPQKQNRAMMKRINADVWANMKNIEVEGLRCRGALGPQCRAVPGAEHQPCTPGCGTITPFNRNHAAP